MRLVVLILLLCPGAAFADPVTIGAVLSSTAFTIGTYAVSWGSVIFTVGSIVYGQSNARKQQQKAADQERLARAAYADSLQDRTVSGVTTETPWKYVYGLDRAACNPVAIFSSGPNDEFKHIVAHIAQQQSASIDEIYLNKQPLGPLDAGGNTTGGLFYRYHTNAYRETVFAVPHVFANVPNAGSLTLYRLDSTQEVPQPVFPSFVLSSDRTTLVSIDDPLAPPGSSYEASFQTTTGEPMVTVIKHLGAPGQTVDTALQAAVGAGKWPSTARLQGHTYIYIRLNLNQPEFQGGIPQMEALLHGKIVRNVRTDVMEWSENPADCIFDYLTSELGGVKESSIPMAGFIATANDCDDVVSTGSWSGKRYTFNGTVTSDQSSEGVLEQMAQSMAGGIVSQVWDIYAGKYSAPVISVGQEDIVGEVALSPGLAFNDVYNTVHGQYVGAENNYIANDYQPYQNAAYLAADGEELISNINFPFTNSQQRCTNLARIAMEDSRNSFSMTGKFSLKLWGVRVGERISFTSAIFGQTNKVFRLTDKSFAPDRSMQLSFKEDTASIYDLADETEVDATPNTGLPNPFSIDALLSLTLESGDAQLLIQDSGDIVSRILATWPMTTSPGIIQNGVIQIEFREEGQDIWQKAEAAGSETSAYLSPVNDGKLYLVRARAFNSYLNAASDWVYATLHQVIGKTEPPPNVTYFTVLGQTFTWTPVVAKDLAGYQARFNFGQNTAWGTATPLHSGLITESPWTPLVYPSGAITVLVKAIDTSGNESATAASIQTNLGDPIVANLIETVDYKALGFPSLPNSFITLGVGQYLQYDISDFQSFSRASVGAYYDVAGVLQSAAVDVPRFGYHPITHSYLGLLIEAAETRPFPHYLKFDGTNDAMGTAAFVAGTLTNNMDAFFVVRRGGAGTATLGYDSGATKFFASMESGSAVVAHANAGTPTYLVNGVAVAGGTATTRGQLHTALAVGPFSILEIRNLDLSTWTDFFTGGLASYRLNGGIAGMVICPAQSNAKRAEIRDYFYNVLGKYRAMYGTAYPRSDALISDLFASGQSGLWVKPSDLPTLFQDGAGTTVTAVEQSVGKASDKSGRGHHLVQATSGNRPVVSARMNLLTKTELYSDAAWVKLGGGTGLAPVVTPNVAIAPDGTMTADRVVFDKGAGTASTDFSRLQPFSTGITIAGQPTVAFIWLKSATASSYMMRLDFNGSGSNGVGLPSLITVTPTWQRFEIRISSATDTIRAITLRLRGTFSTDNYADVDVWASQQENAVAPTVYQSVNTTTDYATIEETRAADVCEVTTAIYGIVNGSVVGGNLVADDSGDLFWGADSGNFWGADGALFWPPSTYLQMVYTTTYTIEDDLVGSRLTLLTEIVAESYTIEYRFDTQSNFWGLDSDFFWGADTDLFWPEPTEWQTWPGAIENVQPGEIQFRFTTQAGAVQGAINELTLQFDVEDETEFINDVAIGALGTRLTLTKSYRSIKNVQLTLQTAAGGADHAETADKLVDGFVGPLVYTKNGASLTTGLVDAFIQGVKGR
ncbi:MAG: hypothetical protein V4718_04550 [Pseudomonadota bacterium]